MPFVNSTSGTKAERGSKWILVSLFIVAVALIVSVAPAHDNHLHFVAAMLFLGAVVTHSIGFIRTKRMYSHATRISTGIIPIFAYLIIMGIQLILS